jgi:hypothetical protein
VFVAAPLYSWLRDGEPAITKHTRRVLAARSKAPVEAENVAVTR